MNTNLVLSKGEETASFEALRGKELKKQSLMRLRSAKPLVQPPTSKPTPTSHRHIRKWQTYLSGPYIPSHPARCSTMNFVFLSPSRLWHDDSYATCTAIVDPNMPTEVGKYIVSIVSVVSKLEGWQPRQALCLIWHCALYDSSLYF